MHQPVWKKKQQFSKPALLIILIVVLISIAPIYRHTSHAVLNAIQPAIYSTNLDLALLLASVFLTLGLAFIGIEMANNPPTGERAKWAYRLSFIVVGFLLIVVTYLQAIRNMNQQAAVKIEADKATKAVQTKFDQVTGKLDNIQHFVENPPSGLTQAQVADVVRIQVADIVRTMIAGRSQSSESGPPAQASPVAPTMAPLAPDTQALKHKGMQVAKEINDWIALNSQDVPNPPNMGMPSSSEDAKARTYADRLNSEWRDKFEVQAILLVGNLHIKGLNLACIDTISGAFQNNPAYILKMHKLCEDRIEQAAQDLN
jgi:hypothetical protein